MRVTVCGVTVMVLGSLLFGCGETPTQPEPVPTPAPTPTSNPIRVFLDQQGEFETAIRELGTRTVIDFEDVDARPVSGTISGRTPFDGRRYVSRGILFSNPNSVPLYVAPGGLPWNSTNSLSIGRFPFDSLPQTIEAPFVEDDDLVAIFEPGCSAAAFSVIDKGEIYDDFIQFFDAGGELILTGTGSRVAFPRTFLGIVSSLRPIARISISERADDADDVTYDDFVCVR